MWSAIYEVGYRQSSAQQYMRTAGTQLQCSRSLIPEIKKDEYLVEDDAKCRRIAAVAAEAE